MDQPKKKKIDPFFRLKWFAYCTAEMPENLSFDQLVHWAKFQLAVQTKTLMKDPIWDSYTSEEILIEYYAHRFNTNKEALKEFEVALGTAEAIVDSFADWAEKQIEKDEKERVSKMGDLEENISFDPSKDVLGE